MGARIVYNGEFQHHGIMGQKWGVITKNVGVNYVPVGRQKTRGETAKPVAKGATSGIATAAKGTARAFATGAKKLKASYDESKAKKEEEKRRNHHNEKLTKKDIAKMSDQDIQNAINRKRNEQQLYEMMHPQAAVGKQFFDNYVVKTVTELGGFYAKKFLGMKVEGYLRDYIDKNPNYSDDLKRDLKDRLNVETLTDKLNREMYENDIRTERSRERKLTTLEKDLEYDRRMAAETRKYIDNIYDNEADRVQARIRNNVATVDDLIKSQARQTTIQNQGKYDSIRAMLSPDEYSDSDIIAKVAGIKKPDEGNSKK